jgi:hypothetical protein
VRTRQPQPDELIGQPILRTKICPRRGEDRNQNEPMFDFTSKPGAAAFIRVSSRVAARIISFWSRPVTVLNKRRVLDASSC